MSLIDEVMEDVAKAPRELDAEAIMQVRLNKVTTHLVETEIIVKQQEADIERLVKENTHLRETLKQYTLKASDTKLRALVDKFIEKAKEYKIQSPIIRK